MNMLSLNAPVTLLGATDMTLWERVVYAGEMTLLGMLAVFAVLAILWLAIVIMKSIFEARAKQATEAPAEEPTPAPQVPAQPAAVPQVPAQPATVPQAAPADDAALLAAITAAIAVVWESEHPGTGFRVVSYRHADKRSAWNTK